MQHMGESWSRLKILSRFPVIKGPWQVLKVSDEEKRPYLITRGADQNTEFSYSIIDRSARGDCTVEKYFPARQGAVTLPSGKRRNVTERSMQTWQSGHLFQTGTETYKVVGKLDVVSESVVPGYIGHYLDR